MLKTTGEKDPATNRLRLTVNDLVEMKRALDNLRVPSDGRRLVLCPDHVNDLLLTSQAFREQYNIDRNSGKVGNLYGFEIYEYGNNPLYTTAGVKKALVQRQKPVNFRVRLPSTNSGFSRQQVLPRCIIPSQRMTR